MCANHNHDHSNRQIFQIPVKNYPKFKAEMARLSKKSVKAGGWEIGLMVFGTVEDKATGAQSYEVFVEAPDVRLGGHRFIARLDHSQSTGNIIRMMPNTDVELPLIYRTAAPACDHCKINRQRRDTFVVQNEETGALSQIGSTCLQDFLGVADVKNIARLAEIMGYVREVTIAAQAPEYTEGEKEPRSLNDLRHIPVHEYLLHCAAAIRISGSFRPSSWGAESTRSVAMRSLYMWNEVLEITDADYETVGEAMTWIEKLGERRSGGEALNNYEHNVLVVGEALVIEGRAAGLAASIIGCYKRNMTPRPAAPKPVLKVINIGDMTAIMDLFNKAGEKLRYPKITISFDGVGEIVMGKAGSAAKYPGTINVMSPGGYGNNTWYGRIHLDGRFEANRRVPTAEALEKALYEFAADPAGVAAAYGHRSGNCCFCHKTLTDQRSAAVGYGKTCASNYDLPYPTMAQAKVMVEA